MSSQSCVHQEIKAASPILKSIDLIELAFNCMSAYLSYWRNLLVDLSVTFYIFYTEVMSPECQVFIQYYSQIVNNMSAKSLCPHFVAKNIILSENQDEIVSATSSKKAAMLLLSSISCALETEIVESFYKFLDIVEQHGNVDSRDVALAIRRKLSKLKLNHEESISTHSATGNYVVKSLRLWF